MKNTLFLLIMLFYIDGFSQSPSNDQHWQLIWKDEFDFLDTGKWFIRNHFDHYGGAKESLDKTEPEVYTDRTDNVFVNPQDKYLIIRLLQENYTCPGSSLNDTACSRQKKFGVSYPFTSGWVESKGDFYVKYGYIESRIRMPYGYGFWPAFWTFVGFSVQRHNAAEIDIAEMVGDEPPVEFTSCIHRYYCPDDGSPPCPHPDYSFTGLMLPYYEFHTYAIEWSPTRITWYIDNKIVRLLNNHEIVDPVKIILNLAVLTGHNPSLNLPAEMAVDYVRVYSLKEDCDQCINEINYDFHNYNNRLKNFISIGGMGSNNYLSNNDNIILRASQFIDLSGDFSVPVGASFYADANNICPNTIGTKCTQVFNPCTYNFTFYDNSIKKIIELGDHNCNIQVTPTNNNIEFLATDYICLKPGASISTIPGKYIELKIESCN